MANKNLKPDTLNMEVLAQRYGLAYRIVNSDPELKNLFMEATGSTGSKTQMTPQEFAIRLKDTQWYQRNGEYAAKTLVAQAEGGANWKAMLDTASMAVNAELTRLGRQGAYTDAEKHDLALQYMMNGWGDQGRGQLMTNALINGGSQDQPAGGILGNVADALRKTASNNGLTLSQSFYDSAEKSIGMGLSTIDDQMRTVREQAATQYPLWADKIRNGQDAIDLASGYINAMANTFEIDPSSIRLDDPYLKQAFGQVDQQGNPKAMGLWDFQRMLRNDPRWMQTKQAQDQMASTALGVLQTFGFMG